MNPHVHQDYRIYRPDGISPALASNRGGGSAAHPLIPYGTSQDQKLNDPSGPSQTPSAGHYNQPKVAVINRDEIVPRAEDIAMNLDANYHKGRDNHGARTMMLEGSRIRRLTPRECERLMSWPDDHTRYGDYGDGPKEISDTQRYKMCGNGVVSAVVAELVKAHLG